MFRQHSKSLRVFLVLILGTFFLLGSADTSSGQVIDSPVGNLTYKCGVKVDKTDQEGWFECSVFPIRFFVGSLEIGAIDEMPSDNKVFIQDLVGVPRSNFDNEKVIKIARFLQSLDNKSSTNIWLADNLEELFLDTQKSFDNLTIGEIEGILGEELVSEKDAVQHLKYYSEVSQNAVGSKYFTVDSANGTALDTQANLLWQNSGLGHSTRDSAIARCDNLEFVGFSDWRLPTQAESKIFHFEMNKQGDVPQQTFSGCTAEVVLDGYVKTKKGADQYAGEAGDSIGFGGGANVRCVRDAGGSPDTITSIEDKIVERHNYYRQLVFTDSDLVWDTTLAAHAQAWADYLVANYTPAHRASGQSPHASQFNASTHGISYQGEGENIAWSSNGRGYLTDSPIDIDDIAVADGSISGSVDAWASEKAYYDYDTNTKKVGYESKAIGHYTQLAWQKTTKVGCGKASGSDGEHVVCRYEIAGNLSGTKPYCSYTISDLYNNSFLVFTNAIIEDKIFAITKVLEDRTACTRTETADSTLSFTGTTTAAIPNYNTFNTSGGTNLWNMDFDDILIDSEGRLVMTNTANDRYMRLKLIGETALAYSVEAYWWVNNNGLSRSAILRLAK